jgi:hypothetical protein
MTEYTKGQIVSAKTPSGVSELFKVMRVEEDYFYLKSCYYSADGEWRASKSDPSKVERY